jgi:alginate O-acetyltransferase complex protein AlgI
MLFHTPEFLVFSCALLAVLAVVHRDTPRKVVLLIASYVFYMWWNPAFILLIGFTTAVNHWIGAAIARTGRETTRRGLLILGLCLSLGLLAYFKYAGFLADNTLVLMRALGFDVHWTAIEVTLPVGISFYTFHNLSYTIDVYRRKIPAAASPLDFALYIAFFPQLVAGPIVRAAVFLPQLRGPIRLFCDQATFFLILRGLAKKVMIADNITALPDAVFASPGDFPSLVIWIAAVCFAVQIYCDFSGYSDIAIALSRVFGFRLPLNFDHPYLARNPSDFWRRWHISLSSWLRDYLYVSLGGNREGRLRTYRNLTITMLLGGLWHGASWNFVLWGLLHGGFLVVHRGYGEIRRWLAPGWRPSEGRIAWFLSILAAQYCVLLAWIPFRVRDMGDAWTALRKFVFFDFDLSVANLGLGNLSFFSTLLLLAAFAALHASSRASGQLDRFLGRVRLGWAALVCFVLGFAASCLWPLSEQPFIYFQF